MRIPVIRKKGSASFSSFRKHNDGKNNREDVRRPRGSSMTMSLKSRPSFTRQSQSKNTSTKTNNSRTSLFPSRRSSSTRNSPTKDDDSSSVSPTPTYTSTSSSSSAASTSYDNESKRLDELKVFESSPALVSPTSNNESNRLDESRLPSVIITESQNDRKVDHFLPSEYVKMITKVYGGNSSSSSPSSSLLTVDLYRDVFHVSTDASDETILAAYLQKGHKILTDTKVLNTTSSSSKEYSTLQRKLDFQNIGSQVKSKFVATSMAYEILSSPPLRDIYRRQCGLTAASTGIEILSTPLLKDEKIDDRHHQETLLATATANTERTIGDGCVRSNVRRPSTSVLRRSSFLDSSTLSLRSSSSSLMNESSSSRTSSIRWKDHVEERTFKGHPDEHDPSIRRLRKRSILNGTNSKDLQSPLSLPVRNRRSRSSKNNGSLGNLQFVSNDGSRLDAVNRSSRGGTRGAGRTTSRGYNIPTQEVASMNSSRSTERATVTCNGLEILQYPKVSKKQFKSRLIKMENDDDFQFQSDIWDIFEDFMDRSLLGDGPCS